jgi:hypothetical protein
MEIRSLFLVMSRVHRRGTDKVIFGGSSGKVKVRVNLIMVII